MNNYRSFFQWVETKEHRQSMLLVSAIASRISVFNGNLRKKCFCTLTVVYTSKVYTYTFFSHGQCIKMYKKAIYQITKEKQRGSSLYFYHFKKQILLIGHDVNYETFLFLSYMK